MFSIRASSRIGYCSLHAAAIVGLSLGSLGCGMIADKERIVIAEIDGTVVRRGDLTRVLRNMSNEERPLIQNKGDLLDALNRYLDKRLLDNYAKKLVEEKRITVSRERATEFYFQRNPDKRQIYQMIDPGVLNISQADLNAVKAQVEFEIDDVESAMLRGAAMNYRVLEAIETHIPEVAEEEFEQEYNFLKNGLQSLERVTFLGIRFPVNQKDAVGEAAAVRRRVDEGEIFERVYDAYRAKSTDYVLPPVDIENNPSLEKYRLFWATVTGCAAGDIFGPILLPSPRVVGEMASGDINVEDLPNILVVLKILEHTPATQLTRDQAKGPLQRLILPRKIAQLFREEHAVRVIKENLPDPAGYGNQFKGSIIETG